LQSHTQDFLQKYNSKAEQFKQVYASKWIELNRSHAAVEKAVPPRSVAEWIQTTCEGIQNVSSFCRSDRQD